MSSVFLDEYGYLVHLVRCAIHGEQPQPIPDPQWFEGVFQCGVWHRVANIAFYSIEKLEQKPPAELYRRWEACRDKAVIADITQSFARDEIAQAFQASDIRFLEVQGTWIKKFYPQPEYRTMSDVDFIIDLDNLPKAGAILEELGYQCKTIAGVEVDGFRPPNVNVEIHTDYFTPTSAYYRVMRPPFASVEEAGQYDIHEFYIYNMIHIAKHYHHGGCGIRRVLDAYYLNLHYGHLLDRQYLQSVFEEANVLDFVNELTALADSWFGKDSLPGERNDMARYIFSAGLHGTEKNVCLNQLESQHGKGLRFVRLRYFLQRVFSRKAMLKRYPVLKRWKLLYPFCWVHRLFLAVKNRKKIAKEVKTVLNAEFDG